MAEAPAIQEYLEPVISSIHEQLHTLGKKYESMFSPESKEAFNKVIQVTDESLATVRTWVPHSGTAAYLSTGSQEQLSQAAATLQQHIDNILAGKFPLPRSSKEELANMRQKLDDVKQMVDIPEDRAKVESKLLDLYKSGVENRMDPESLESQVDHLTQKVLFELYGESHLDEEDLQRELEWLIEAVEKFGNRGHWVVYSLTLNSLERLHGVQAQPEEEATEEPEESVCEEVDEDDPFFMPVPIGALKMADAQKFSVLAEPIAQSPDGVARPMLELKDDGSSRQHSRANSSVDAGSKMVLTAADYEQVPTQDTQTASGQSPAKPAASVDAAADKFSQLSKFLQGETQGSSTFHAQMRLSQEGCIKLATFLEKSGRIRAISLAANYLGDDSIKIICKGLRKNKTVASIDLPNNNITDEGAMALAEAISDNQTIFQLELGANMIGDRGAMAIAKVIRRNSCMKKIGLAHNRIGREGCLALADAARGNQSLKQVQVLPGNPIQERDARALAKAIRNNQTRFSIRQLLNIPESIDWTGSRKIKRKQSQREAEAQMSRAASQRTQQEQQQQQQQQQQQPQQQEQQQQQAQQQDQQQQQEQQQQQAQQQEQQQQQAQQQEQPQQQQQAQQQEQPQQQKEDEQQGQQ